MAQREQLWQQAHGRVAGLLRRGDLDAAGRACQQLVTDFPGQPGAWFLGSRIALKRGALPQALGCAERALAAAPGDPLLRVHRANCLVAMHRRAEAVAACTDLAAEGQQSPEVLAGMGAVYTACGDYERALPCYEQAAAQEPGNHHYHYNVAACLRFLGRVADAESAYDRVISLAPQEYEAYLMRADLVRRTPANNHVEEIQQALTNTKGSPRGEAQLSYALARELEDLGRDEEAFAALARGAGQRRASMAYDVAADIAVLERIRETFDSAALAAAGPGCTNDEPLFVVGLPRSGTTLVERILASHSAVQGAGELNDFALALVRLAQHKAGRRLPREELVPAALQVDPAALGEAYIASTRPGTGQTPHFVDKLPANYLYLGLIHRALPAARLVALRRRPMDSCFAMFKTLFKGAYPFTYDLEELGRYYVAWDRLMRHWQEVLGDALLVVDYESLVADQQAESQRLLEHCGLAWEDAVLDFHDHPDPALTASTLQVRQPVYTSSVDRWRRFERQLEPLRAVLDAAGIDVD